MRPIRPIQRTSLAAVAAVAAVVLGASGCGGDDGPSKSEFVGDANAICKRHYVKISAAASKVLAGGKLPSPREFGALAKGTIIPEYTAQIDELRDVEAPDDQSDAYRKWLDDSQALRDQLDRNPATIQQAQALKPVNDQADRLGLSDQCHIGPG